MSHDARVLGRILLLPAAPLDVAFELTPRGIPSRLGPTDYELVALLHFDGAALRGFAKDPAGADTRERTVPSRAWFAPAVKAKFVSVHGDGGVVRGQELDARAWLRPGYMGGATAVDGTDYVIVSGSTS